MNVLIIGSGGREHALVDVCRRSDSVAQLYAAPGNPGMLVDARLADVDADDHKALVAWCQQRQIDLVIVGAEAPLVDGVADALRDAGIACFGPSKAAAELEGSKAFMKEMVVKAGVPTAFHGSFTDAAAAKNYIRRQAEKTGDSRIVVKTDGLAAGKGVILADTTAEAEAAVDEMFGGKFGAAGQKVVIEEFLDGEEASVFAICDGERAILCGSAQDHKRVGEGDTGLNTGGMGTYSPAPVMDHKTEQHVLETLIQPALEAMKKEGKPYIGFLFAGVMVTKDGAKLLEYNVRFGDPEAQVILPRVTSDLPLLLKQAAEGKLSQDAAVALSDKTALCVVMASKGYPEAYRKGTEIKALASVASLPDVRVFHAGTKEENGRMLAVGGRVLGITALGSDVLQAQQRAYEAVDKIDWPEGFCRRDIGWRAIARLKQAA